VWLSCESPGGGRYWPNMLVQSCINSVLSRLPSLLTSNISTVYRAISSSKPSRSCRMEAISFGVKTPLPSVSNRSKQLAMSSLLHTTSLSSQCRNRATGCTNYCTILNWVYPALPVDTGSYAYTV